MNIFGAVLVIPLLGLWAQEGIGLPGGIAPDKAASLPGWTIPHSPSAADAPPPHDLHVSYGNLGVDGPLAVLQFRVFRDDLEEALRSFHGLESLSMEVSPEVDALFLGYLREHFILEADDHILEGRIIGSGDDELDREPVWWYQIRFDAPAPIRSARITNTFLFDLFGDQSNVLRVVEFPEEDRRAYYFAPGEETIEVTFGGYGQKLP